MSRSRLLNYSASRGPLAANARHGFAAGHALEIYATNSIYSFIPKNACSTMRYSIAIANQCIAGENEVGWIHANNGTFQASLKALVTADYTFVILRCPFSRLASCFLDKIVGSTRIGAIYERTAERDSADVTFETFVQDLEVKSNRLRNEHWRPQVDFLVYKEYDDYFCVEDFPSAQTRIMDQIGLRIHDARHLTAHGTDQFEKTGSSGEYARVAMPEISKLKKSGNIPSVQALYSERAAMTVARLFAADISLYKERCGRAPTLDVQPVTTRRAWRLQLPVRESST